jgi:hypothetical protein
MAGLDDVNIDSLSLDQMESLARGETAGLLPEVSPVEAREPKAEPKLEPKAEPKPEPKIEPKAEPKAEPAKAEPKVEPAADDDDEPAPADPNNATIPYQKYAREKKQLRTLLKSLETKLTETQGASAKERDEMRAKWERADERLKLLSEAMTPPAAEQVDADPEPDPNTDILAWVNWNRRENARLREAVSTTQTTVETTRAEQQLHDNYQRDVADYATNVAKDWGPAYNHLLTTRATMLQQQGYPEPQIVQIIRNEERGLVQRAVKAGKRPAAMIYEMAKSMGYRTPAPVPDPAPVPAAAANGHANGNGAAAVPAAEAKPSVVEEVERIQRGMAGSKSLADVGGARAGSLCRGARRHE